jgi:hypothetical protein
MRFGTAALGVIKQSDGAVRGGQGHGGMAPKSQQDLMRQALKENRAPKVFGAEAEVQAWRKLI